MPTLQQRIQRFDCGITYEARINRDRVRFAGAATSFLLTGFLAHKAFGSVYTHIRDSNWEIVDRIGDFGYTIVQSGAPFLSVVATLALGYALHRGIRQCVDSAFPSSIPDEQGWEAFSGFDQYRGLVQRAPHVIGADIILLSPLPRDAYLAEYFTALDEATLGAGQRPIYASVVLEDRTWYIPHSTLGGDRKDVDDSTVVRMRPRVEHYADGTKNTSRQNSA